MKILVLLVFFMQIIFADKVLENEIIKYQVDKKYANEFAKIIVQSKDGRMKPLDSLNIAILNKIAQKTTFYGLNHNQTILGMIYTANLWKKVTMYNISSDKLKNILNTKKKQVSYNTFYNKDGTYKLKKIITEINNKSEKEYDSFEKEIVKINERVQISKFIYQQSVLKIFPLKDARRWHSPYSLKQNFYNTSKYKAQKLYVLNKNAILYGIKTNNWDKASKALTLLKEFQYEYGKNLIPSKTLQKAELFYNKYLIFEKIYPIYFFCSLILISLIFIRLFTNKKLSLLKNIIILFVFLTFFSHTLNLILRWYISQHAPWSNAYESMIFISWTTIFAGFFFIKKSEFALSSTTLLGSILLFVAHLSWMDQQITTLSPSLQSIWLTIHVAIISASYGFLALSLLLGLITLILLIINKKDRNFIDNINEAFRSNELSMILGLVLLTIGTLLGSVWANESWGRIWEWDPKETWSLASILVYMVILHLRFIPKVFTIYNFSVLSIIGYSTILMTYFGVNYFFEAIHVYASNTNANIPTFVYYIVLVIFIIIALAYKNRDLKVNNE